MTSLTTSAPITARWAKPEELPAVARLSAQIFDPAIHPGKSWITRLVEDIASGAHPQADPHDYAIAVDDRTGSIVGGAVLFTQPWRVGTTTFLTGRPEVVVTAPAHRGQGIMRRLLDLLHMRSAERGHIAQCITGVPGIYGHLGYGYTHPLGDGRIVRIPRERPPHKPMTLVPAERSHASSISALLDVTRPQLGVTTPQTADYLSFTADQQNPASLRGIRTLVTLSPDGQCRAVFELARGAGRHRQVVGAAIGEQTDPADALLALVDQELFDDTEVTLSLGELHELYDVVDALGWPSQPELPDRWYFRVPDVSIFLDAIRPELDSRLAASIFRRCTGELTLDLPSGSLSVQMEDGAVIGVSAVKGGEIRLATSSDALPSLLLGARSLRDLVAATPETQGTPLALALGAVLFPRLLARTLPLN